MILRRARSAGFCFGVALALKRLDQELAKSSLPGNCDPGRLVTFGPIIHNPLVMEKYERQGVACTEDIGSIRPGDRVVVRAHGIPRQEEEELKKGGAILADATCPKVKKAQLAIAKSHAKGKTLILFGEKDHPEVRGLLSYAGDDSLVFGSLKDLENLELNPAVPYCLAAQTTQERAIYQSAEEYLEERLGRKVTVLDTICNATRERQNEVQELCADVQAMVVVGGFNSGNTRRLAEVAASSGVYALHVEQVSDITAEQRKLLSGFERIGLTAGASTPEAHIREIEAFLQDLERNDQ